MDYFSQGSTATLLQCNFSIRESELGDIAASCLLGLQYLHEQNIRHEVVLWR